MADPRAEALLRAMSGGGGMPAPEEEMGMMAPEGEPATAEDAVTQALTALEPFMDDPRIAQAASVLQEVVGGPSEMPEDTMMSEDAPPML